MASAASPRARARCAAEEPQEARPRAESAVREGRAGLEGKEDQGAMKAAGCPFCFQDGEGKDPGPGEDSLLSRLRAQVASKLRDGVGDDLDEMAGLASDVYAVHVNGGWHVSDVPPRLGELALRHGVSFELGGGEHGSHDTQRAD